MPQSNTVSEFLGRGVIFEAHEAVAVAQQLIANERDEEVIPPFGPPTVESVEIADDGSVFCRHCGVTPAVSEIGILLDAMLPRGTFVRVPGGLRYTIARALSEVDAPPFDSVAALAAVLERYGRANHREVLRALVERSATPHELVQQVSVPVPLPVPAQLPAPAVLPAPTLVPARTLVPEPALMPEPALVPEFAMLSKPEPEYEPVLTARSSLPWLAIGAVAASISFSASYVLVSHSRIQHQNITPVVQSAQSPSTATAPTPVATQGVQGPLTGRTQRAAAVAAASTSTAESVVRAAPRDESAMFSPAFASNGTALFFHTGRSTDARSALAEKPLGNDLEVMTILDDGAKNYHVQPSPDGARIAFDSDRDGERGVYVAARDGSDVHRVSGPGYSAVPTWSPDGTQLAFIRGEPERPRVWNLWLTTLATGQTRRLTDFRYGQTWNASWFPDGKAVAYTHEDRLAVLDLATGVARTFTSPVTGRLMRTPAVSPDGRHVIFQVARSGAWLIDLSDGSMRCVLTDPTAEEFAWSPDGRRVAFHSRRDGVWGIWIMAPPE